MVVPCGFAAAQAAGAAGSASATALGLGMGKTDLDLTRNLFKMQMRQAKRLWTADWAENSVRHGESCTQSAQQHAESQAMATAAYFQAEKIASQGIKLARDQDSRGYEMSWRAEVRESLRDELANQFNRFNIIMLCDTVCLSCVFSLVADGSPPAETPLVMLNLYLLSMGVSITLFTISLWCAVIVVRRLHDNTASILERKLFAQSEDLQKVWQHQLSNNLPTGPSEMALVNLAYEKWVAEFLDPIGKYSIHLMSMGVVAMFVTAGLLTHAQYGIEYNAISAAYIFWSTVVVTSATVIFMKCAEDAKEKMKQGVYDVGWQDKSTIESGPFAKISRMAGELFSSDAVRLASTERVESFGNREQMEREFCADTKSLHHRVESLRKESEQRAKTRKDVLQLLTTAAEELDALPEELTSRLNKLLHDIDEADSRTADFVTMQTETMLGSRRGNSKNWSRLRVPPRKSMAVHPIDAQRIPISLPSLRKKLGEIKLTTLLRLKNVSDEPLRLKSGVQLKDGKYIKSLNASDPHNNSVCYHLYPVTEIPARTEVVIAARNNGGWVPTSGVSGKIVYTNRDESWVFEITFNNMLVRNVRKCQVQAIHTNGSDDDDEDGTDQYWQISKTEIDPKINNEVAISIDVLRGEQANKAAAEHRHSQVSLKTGFLLKNKAFGLGLQWKQKWCVLTPTEIIYSDDSKSKQKSKILITDITAVRKGVDIVKTNVFEIHVNTKGVVPYKFCAVSPTERYDWIQSILSATDLELTDMEASVPSEDSEDVRAVNDSIECIHESGSGTQVLPLYDIPECEPRS